MDPILPTYNDYPEFGSVYAILQDEDSSLWLGNKRIWPGPMARLTGIQMGSFIGFFGAVYFLTTAIPGQWGMI